MTEFEISEYLEERELYAEVSSREVGSWHVIEIFIDWGDWRKDHDRCDLLMKGLGYTRVTEKLTESDGSDCYSSIHYYIYTGKNN